MKNVLEKINCNNKLEQKLLLKILNRFTEEPNLSKIIDEEKRNILSSQDDSDEFGKFKLIKFLDKVYKILNETL